MVMSKTATIVGCGRMGTAVAWGMQQLGYYVNLVDPSFLNSNNCVKQLDRSKINYVTNHLSDVENTNVVISSATFSANLYVAEHCAKHEIPYCDLGGDPESTYSIH